MTESNQGPATPGTAARCEICNDAACLAMAICTACKKPLHECSPDSYPEHWRLGYERLKAENASLRAALAAAREVNTRLDAQWAAAEQRNTALQGALREVVRDCEVCDWKCESCGHDYGMTETDFYYFATAALRSTGRADEPQPGMKPSGWYSVIADVNDHARAALHDEERRPQLGECVGHLGAPSNTATPHPKGDTCSFWKPLRALLEEAGK